MVYIHAIRIGADLLVCGSPKRKRLLLRDTFASREFWMLQCILRCSDGHPRGGWKTQARKLPFLSTIRGWYGVLCSPGHQLGTLFAFPLLPSLAFSSHVGKLASVLRTLYPEATARSFFHIGWGQLHRSRCGSPHGAFPACIPRRRDSQEDPIQDSPCVLIPLSRCFVL